MITASTLRQALPIAEQIEKLEQELAAMFAPEPKLSPTGRKIAKHRASNGNLGQGLAPAVVGVLKASKKPLRVSEILDRVLAAGYKFTSKKPIRVLGARIYSLNGVKKVGEGLFAAA